MLQTALDLSKQRPQTLAKVAFGAVALLSLLPTGASDLLLKRLSIENNEMGIGVSLLMLLFSCIAYLLGSLIMSLEQIEITNMQPSYFVFLSSRVFETGNGLLMQEFQETNRTTQLFGGLLGLIFLVGWVGIAKLLLIGGFIDSVSTTSADFQSTLVALIWSILLGVFVVGFVCVRIFSTVRRTTLERYKAIDQETYRLLEKRTELK